MNKATAKWLVGRPHETVLALASRVGLRAIPTIASAGHRGVDYDAGEIIMLIFRAAAVSWVASRFPAHNTQLRSAAAAASQAVSNAATHAQDDAEDEWVATSSAVNVIYLARLCAGVARIATQFDSVSSFCPNHSFEKECYSQYSRVFSVNADPEQTADFATALDVEALESGATPAELIRRPLWPLGIPNWALNSWADFASTLERDDQNWSVWIDWYRARLDGSPPIEFLEVARSAIADEVWEKGSNVANAHIKRLFEEHVIESI